MWRPNVVAQQVQQTNYVPQTVTQQVPMQVCKYVPEQVVRKVPVQVCRMVTEQQVRKVPVTTCKMVYEERVEQVPYQVCRMVAEQQTIRVPRVVEKRIPVTYTYNVPRVVCYRVPLDACGNPIAASSCRRRTPAAEHADAAANADARQAAQRRRRAAAARPGWRRARAPSRTKRSRRSKEGPMPHVPSMKDSAPKDAPTARERRSAACFRILFWVAAQRGDSQPALTAKSGRASVACSIEVTPRRCISVAIRNAVRLLDTDGLAVSAPPHPTPCPPPKTPLIFSKASALAFVGKLASMARRDAAQLVRQHGATVLEKPDASAHLIVVGEEEFPLPDIGDQDDWFDEATRRQVEAGRDRGHHRNAALAAAGTGRFAARHPPALHAGHAGRVAAACRWR